MNLSKQFGIPARLMGDGCSYNYSSAVHDARAFGYHGPLDDEEDDDDNDNEEGELT